MHKWLLNRFGVVFDFPKVPLVKKKPEPLPTIFSRETIRSFIDKTGSSEVFIIVTSFPFKDPTNHPVLSQLKSFYEDTFQPINFFPNMSIAFHHQSKNMEKTSASSSSRNISAFSSFRGDFQVNFDSFVASNSIQEVDVTASMNQGRSRAFGFHKRRAFGKREERQSEDFRKSQEQRPLLAEVVQSFIENTEKRMSDSDIKSGDESKDGGDLKKQLKEISLENIDHCCNRICSGKEILETYIKLSQEFKTRMDFNYSIVAKLDKTAYFCLVFLNYRMRTSQFRMATEEANRLIERLRAVSPT